MRFSLSIAGEVFTFDFRENSFFLEKYKKFITKEKSKKIIKVPDFKNLKETRFDNFLRKFFVSEGLKRNFLLLHSSAILFKGNVFLFCGNSGAGKSRIRKFFEKGYSDELNIISGNFIYPSPFYSEKESDIFVKKEISAIYFLERGKGNFLKKLKENEFFKEFLKNVFLPGKTKKIDVIFKIWNNVKEIKAFALKLKDGFMKEDLIEILERNS